MERNKFMINHIIDNIYTSVRIIDGKPRKIIVDRTGRIVNRDPSKEELKDLEKEPRKAQDTRKYKKYTDEELLDYLKLFYEENNRIPTVRDFLYNSEYPSFATYQIRFGGWNQALKMVGLDIDTMIKQGILQNNNYKGRLFEILINDTFENKSIDLSGDNCMSPFDGLCPNGASYEAKSAGLIEEYGWAFHISRYKYIEWYYFGAFDKDYTELIHVWRVPNEIVEKEEKDRFYIGLHDSKFNVRNMIKYEITDKFIDNPILDKIRDKTKKVT